MKIAVNYGAGQQEAATFVHPLISRGKVSIFLFLLQKCSVSSAELIG
jgi:hypothetical protein